MELKFRTWRHRTLGYETTVTGVDNYPYSLNGESCLRQMVSIDRGYTARSLRYWQIELFLERFEPIGDPIQSLTCWDHLD